MPKATEADDLDRLSDCRAPGQGFDVEFRDPIETVHLYVKRDLVDAIAREFGFGELELEPHSGEIETLIEALALELKRDRLRTHQRHGTVRGISGPGTACASGLCPFDPDFGPPGADINVALAQPNSNGSWRTLRRRKSLFRLACSATLAAS